MDNRDSEKIVPEQEKGSSTNAEHSYTAQSPDEALTVFQSACERLLDVNHWSDYAGVGSATFEVMDNQGNPIPSAVRKDYFIRIDIPGPGSVSGEGYDWVQVEAIDTSSNAEEDWESIAIRVRPASNPQNDRKDISHFFTDEATSNFVLKRQGNTVIAGVYGRNEVLNTKADKLVDKSRNAAVGIAAVSGGSSIQWNKLVKGLIGK